MEHSETDIVNINFGNQQLDNFLLNEAVLKKVASESPAFRWSMTLVYQTLQKLGELPLYHLADISGELDEAKFESISWDANASGEKLRGIVRTILVLNNLAAKRLQTTIGV